MSDLPRWFDGIPDVESVKAHESDHPRPDGLRLGRLSLGDSEYGGGGAKKFAADERVYGDWVAHHHKSSFERYVAVIRLKELEGRVITAAGFCQWIPLDQFQWAKEARFFPVGQDGLPVGFEVEG